MFKKKYQSRLFTYFLPAPTQMRKAYREKQLDNMLNKLLATGFKIESINTQSINSEKAQGMWIIIQLQPQTNKANELDLNDFLDEIELAITTPQQEENIEGLYYID